MESNIKSYQDHPFLFFFIIFLVWVSLFLLRYTAPSDLLDKDQERPAAYMMDAALNGNWIVQVDDFGKVCSKPPVYTWIGAILILLSGRMNDFALYFPSALSVFGCCILMWTFGSKRFGTATVFTAALILLLSTIGIRILYLARTDAAFSFTTFLTACFGYWCWQKGRGWFWFWMLAALVTLTKGPLGIILASGGFLGFFWERKRMPRNSNLLLNHGIGIIVYIVITMGWMYLSYQVLGNAVIEKLFGVELIGHADWTSDELSPGFFFFLMPSFYFITRFFPWSIMAAIGLWHVWKHPSVNAEERCFERFLAAYLCFGIILFSMFPHQRADHLFPLLPAAALLAGREIVRQLSKKSLMKYLAPAGIGLWLFLLTGYAVYYFKIDPAHNELFAQTEGVHTLAKRFEKEFGNNRNLAFVDVPFGLQYYLNTMKHRISYEAAADLMKGSTQVFVAVKDTDKLKQSLPSDQPLYIIMQWPETGTGLINIVSNKI